MALSFKEKRGLQADVRNCQTSLAASPDFKTKRSLQKRLADALAKLMGIGRASKSIFDRLMAGEFLNLTPGRFLIMVKKALEEINQDVKRIIEPLREYMHAHKPTETGAVMESAPYSGITLRLDSRTMTTDMLGELMRALEAAGATGLTLKMV